MLFNFRVESTMSINYDDEDCQQNIVSKELKSAAGKMLIIFLMVNFFLEILTLGDLGKELKNLITMMEQDDDLRSTWRRTIRRESPL